MIMPYVTGSSSAIQAVIASACSLYIILIMTLMCLIMYSKQRKKAYLSMVTAFLFIMTYEGLNIHFAFSPTKDASSYSWIHDLQIFSFLLLNLSVYQLYKRMNKASYIVFGVLALLFPVPLISAVIPFGGTSWQTIYLDVYQLGILYAGGTFISRRIGQRGKYFAGIAVYFVYIALGMLSRYADLQGPWIDGALLWLPLAYYTIIFLILFERIVELMQSIYRSSITDGLTNLYNRRYFTKQLNRYVDQGVKVSMIFCDIDNFKKLNDTQGHHRADLVLKQVAAIIDEEVTDVGLSGRFGGEELVALVVDKRAKVAQIAERIRARVAEESIVTLSIGYSSLRKNVSGEELVKQADQAMYHSKTTGKNKVSPYQKTYPKQEAEETVS
ncbi:GGDEF domain-containing protein [Paenibacillus sp. KQZ6P-2]|uniref:GGDEF domain-containing protein n=1 Tax=Paenibacillus mangrovi TaxID=2931978 RepID=A0A9X1WJA1_9BACL|nr:GGDEF domain-containing protein [Paenibacillus mangrovi]MCJ8010392.1 GGDEF domain-containing protein [Paenibacillus mangrovi]